MLLRVGRLHQVARQEIIEGRKAAGFRMAPGIALHRGKPLGSELCRDRAHPDLGINQNMRRIGCDLLPPALDRQRPLHEALAERTHASRLRIGLALDVITEEPEPAAVELFEPALKEAPTGVPAEKAADEAHAHALTGWWRRRQCDGRVA